MLPKIVLSSDILSTLRIAADSFRLGNQYGPPRIELEKAILTSLAALKVSSTDLPEEAEVQRLHRALEELLVGMKTLPAKSEVLTVRASAVSKTCEELLASNDGDQDAYQRKASS